MMGGVDGDLSGYKYFNSLGGWPVRDDIEPAEGSTPYSELHVSVFNVPRSTKTSTPSVTSGLCWADKTHPKTYHRI